MTKKNRPGVFTRRINAIYTPSDDILITAKNIFAEPPSAVISITRHGFNETIFSIYEIEQISESLNELAFDLKHHNSPFYDSKK